MHNSPSVAATQIRMVETPIYHDLKDLWSALIFDWDTMPEPIRHRAVWTVRGSLSTMLASMEGQSFEQWAQGQADEPGDPRAKLREISELLREAGAPAGTIREGVLWLRERAERAEHLVAKT